VAVVGLSACGDDDDSTSSSSTGTSTTSTVESGSKPSGDPIKLGFICSCTGAQKAVFSGTQKVIEAWASDVNANGGINGSPVEVTAKDDGGDPAKALQAAKELVEDDEVIAIVGNTSLADASWAEYVSKAGVPVVGGSSPTANFLANPLWFPSGGNVIALTYGTLNLAAEAGKKNVGVAYCAESPVCAQIVPLAQGMGQMLGLTVTPLKIASTAPNYTAQCLQMKDKGVDALYVAHNGPIVQKVTADCAKQNYKPLTLAQATTGTPDYLSDPNLQGAPSAGTNANPYDDSLPAVKRYRDALEKYSPGFVDSPEFTYDAFYPWSGGLLFEAAAAAGKLDATSTPEDVTNAVLSLKDETLGGTTGPIVYTKGKPAFTPCWFTETIEDNSLVSANENKPSCLTEEQATQLQAALAG
jgi:branched-chain amino acid transport system substrate-binding protein